MASRRENDECDVMTLVETLIRQYDYLLLSKPICRRGPGGVLLPMYDTRPSSRLRLYTRNLPYPLYEGGGLLQINDCQLDSVIWKEGGISIHRMPSRMDAISFDFSGCVMAVFCLHGIWYSAHIHMGGSNDCTLKWIAFVQQIRPHLEALCMFRPNVLRHCVLPEKFRFPDSFANNEQIYATMAHLWGAVTATGRFVSLCVYPLDRSFRRFKVLFVEEHYLGMNPTYYAPLFQPFRSQSEAKREWDVFWRSRTHRLLFANY